MPKRVLPLTDLQVSKAKPAEKDYKLFDGGGLFLLVTPSGGKLWRLKYRFEGKEKGLHFGAYPDVSLADARQRREEARKMLANGTDPAAVKQAQKAAITAGIENAFEVVALEWFAKYLHTWSKSHGAGLRTRLTKELIPGLGRRPIGEITAPELLKVLQRIESRGALDTAHRVRFMASQIFRYAIATGRAERDPATDLRGALPPAKFKHFAAPTDPKDVAPLLRAIDGYVGSPVVKAALQLAPLLFVRPGELRHAEWAEIDFDQAQWNIPGSKMKMGEPHIVPLCRQSLAVILELQLLTGRGRYLFPCHRSPLRCMSENAVNAGLRRLGFEKTEITGHGFRAMARTILDEVLGFRPDFIEHQLAHAVKDPNGRAYNRTSHLEARRQMMQAWADYLDEIKSGAKVLQFKK